MGTARTLPVGAAAIDVLAGRLDALRGGSVLAPAQVLCATPLMAIGVRRALGSRPGGIAGVHVRTVAEFAVELARPKMVEAGLRQARRSELMAAVRAELQAHPGEFGPVADHRTTEDRLVSFHRELVGLPSEVLDQIDAQAEGLSADALRVVRAATARLVLAGLEDPLTTGQLGSDSSRLSRPCTLDLVAELALEELEEMEEGATGPLVIYLPEPLRPFEGRMVQALARRVDSEVLIGLTGDAGIDTEHLARLTAWSVQGPEPSEVTLAPPAASFLEVADPEEEVRAALREVASHAAAGVPLSDMAVLYASADPYANVLDDQLAAAELPWSGPGHRAVSLSLAGRTLRRLLGLANRGMDRESVITLLAAAPIDGGAGRPAPSGLWDALSRQAGVIDGDHWLPRLAELSEAEDDARQRAELARLAAFIEELAAALQPPNETTWASWGEWAHRLLDRYLFNPEQAVAAGLPDWPEAERYALARIHDLLDRLADLDQLGVPPTTETVEATVLGDMAGSVMPGRPLGQGLYVGPLDSVPGLAFERIAVVGLAEGRFPRTPREDSLLTAQMKAASRSMLMESSTITDIDVRLVGLAAAASKRPALLLSARGDLRSNRSRAWPRALDSLVDTRQTLDSHHRGLLDHGRPVSHLDLGLRSLAGHVDADDPVHTHPLALSDSVLAANIARWDNCERSELTAHTGRVPADRIDPTERMLSPTALETYAACPRKYLFQRVLRLADDERPERIEQITPRDRGTLTHLILERFVAEALDEGDVPEPGEPWPLERRARLFELLDIEVEAARSKGITGGRVKTRLLRRQLYTELLNFLDTDDEMRADLGSTPYKVEYGFGLDEDNPALVGEWAGRQMQLRGSVDRVDLTADGGLLVIDYKGGSGRAFAKMEENPLQNGRRLQLPLYARAVAERLGRDGQRAGIYWLTKENRLRALALDDELELDVESAVGAALDGISGGLFPGVPGEVVGWPRLSFENCRYCDFDRICPSGRQAEWERVRNDESLETISELAGSDEEGQGASRG